MRRKLDLPSKFAPSGDMVRNGRSAVRTAIVTASCMALVLWYASQTRFIVLNLSPSVPLGLYVEIDDEPSAGRLVEFQIPPHMMDDGRHARHRIILKPIAAEPGDHIDTTGDWLLINDRRLAQIFTVDSEGRPLPVWRARRVLQPGEFFVFSARVPNSFDSRYYGPIRRADIIAVRKPLWTWNADVEGIADVVESTHAGGNP
ncbi:MAG: S26 family signal peptidase [Phycisphaerae bacterium]|nr:S26 family signal peptidase [Phycisphaerae bacterium]